MGIRVGQDALRVGRGSIRADTLQEGRGSISVGQDKFFREG